VRQAVRRALASDLTVTLSAGPVITAGWTAESGPGAWLGFAVQHGWFSLGLEARGLFPARTITYEVGRTSYAASFSGLIVPCARWKVVSGCAFFEAGTYIFTIPGRSAGVANALLSVGPRAAIDVPIGVGFAAHAFADLAIHPYLPVFSVRETTESDSEVKSWVTPVVSGVFGAGLAWSR
jgi:hypothetical protein